MPVPLYLDVHVDKAIHDQLKLRGVGLCYGDHMGVTIGT